MKYWEKGKSCPVVATYGQHPMVFMPSYTKFPYGRSEMEVSGGLMGRPLEVLRGPITGLPIPASSEIAIEGEIPPPSEEARAEGPFGEWPGYYSGGTGGTGENQPIIRVKAIYHRNEPILEDEAPLWPGAVKMDLHISVGRPLGSARKRGYSGYRRRLQPHVLFYRGFHSPEICRACQADRPRRRERRGCRA